MTLGGGRMNKETDFALFSRQVPTATDEAVFDLRAVGLLLWGGKWILLICGLLGLAIGIFLASRIEPSYRATAKLLLGTERADVLRGEGVMVEEYFGSTTLMTHIEILSSTKLINRVIDTLGLDTGPPRVPPPELSAVDRVLIAAGLSAPPPPPLPPEAAAERDRL